MTKMLLCLTLLVLNVNETAFAAKRPEPPQSNFCEVQLTSAGLQRLDPMLNLHHEVIQSLLQGLPNVRARLQIIDRSGRGRRADAILDAVAPGLSRLPIIGVGTRFELFLSDGLEEEFHLTGFLLSTPPVPPSSRSPFKVLKLNFDDIDLSKRLPDIQLLGTFLALALGGAADLVDLEFELSPDELESWQAKFSAEPIHFPILSQILSKTHLTYSWAHIDDEDQLDLRLFIELNTHKAEALLRHLEKYGGGGGPAR